VRGGNRRLHVILADGIARHRLLEVPEPERDQSVVPSAAILILEQTTAEALSRRQVTASKGPGSISSLVAPMRQMQFGLKLLF
jgi:hypothetical protein